MNPKSRFAPLSAPWSVIQNHGFTVPYTHYSTLDSSNPYPPYYINLLRRITNATPDVLFPSSYCPLMNSIYIYCSKGFAHKDAIYFSTHKFVGGVQAPGILVAKKKLFRNAYPTTGGGGTVFYVSGPSSLLVTVRGGGVR